MRFGATGVAALLACVVSLPAHAFDLQGHRGARGLRPESTLAGFALALSIGVTTLETDLAVTKDGALVLSHDRYLNPDIVRAPDGRWLVAKGSPIHALTLEELQRYDVGRLNPASRYAQQFPEQRPEDGQRFPTLAELFALAKAHSRPVRLNIETKISPLDPESTVDAATFARLTVEAIRRAKLESAVTIQSFDWRTLLESRKLAPEIETVCLTIETPSDDTVRRGEGKPSPWLGGLDVGAHGGSLPRLARTAGCAAWSPYFRNVSAAEVDESHRLGLRVVPWTVNDPADMTKLIDMNVDGLITDYPDRARKVMADKGIALP